LKIQIIIPLWKRPEVTKFCFDKLKEMIENVYHDFNVLCVISEPEYMKICESYGFNWVAYSNECVGDKINFGIKYALQFYKFDYLMMMNSDSVIKPELFDTYNPLLQSGEKFFGVNKVTFVNFYNDEAQDYKYEFSVIGPAKMIHRSIVEQMKGNLYPSLNKCLDDNMKQNVFNATKIGGKIIDYEGQLVYDIKSDVNIHPYEKFKGRKVENELCSKVA
jgi:hypothetical protein